MTSSDSDWIVLKFGGTSVSSLANWRNIQGIVGDRLATGARVLVVHSALSGVTDRLEKLIVAATAGNSSSRFEELRARHLDLASSLGFDAAALVDPFFSELSSLLANVQRDGRVDDRTRARVMATGELLSTTIG